MSVDEQLTNKQKLVFHLMDKGLSNDEIARVLADVAEEAFEQFTTEAMSIFTQEDKTAIEAAEGDLQADEEIKKRYSERAGRDAEEYLNQLIEDKSALYMNQEHDSETLTAQ